MSSVRVKLVCKQILAELLGGSINFEKIRKLTTAERLSFDTQDVKAMLAALTFIVSNATKFEVADDVLTMELEQLGLPRDICNAICKVYSPARVELLQKFRARSLQLPRLAGVQWRVDYVLASSLLDVVDAPSLRVHLQLTKPVLGSTTSLAFEVTPHKLGVLLSELRQVRALMDAAAQ